MTVALLIPVCSPSVVVDDLGPEAVARGPAEIHPEEHLGPVRGLGAARTGADRQDRAVAVVVAGEQQQRPLPREVLLQRRDVTVQLGLELRVRGIGEQRRQLLDRGRACLEPAPGFDLVAETLGLLQDGLCRALVVPEAGFLRPGVELGDPRLGGPEVKDAPRSTGSARRDP